VEKFYFESVEDVLKLIDEPFPMEGLYCHIENKKDHFYILYENYTPITFVDLSLVTTMGVLKMWDASFDENMPAIDSSFMVAEQATHEYDIKKWIEVALICEADGRMLSMHMREEDANSMGIAEIKRSEEDVRFED
jgi:hypothetical protein